MNDGRAVTGLPVPPHAALRDAVHSAAAELEAAGRSDEALRLSAAVAEWWQGERDWTGAVARQLTVHHDINNALVGVRGNAQLIMMGPAAAAPVFAGTKSLRHAALCWVTPCIRCRSKAPQCRIGSWKRKHNPSLAWKAMTREPSCCTSSSIANCRSTWNPTWTPWAATSSSAAWITARWAIWKA